MRGALFVVVAACGSSTPGVTPDASTTTDGRAVDATPGATDRDRLLATYLAHLQAHPGMSSNGLDGASLTSVCQLWSGLTPSAQSVFLTITARLERSVLDVDASTMLSRTTKLYRIAGGNGSTATDPGQCGGSGNRLVLAIDPTLHGTMKIVNSAQGVVGGNHVIADASATSFWRDSHDLAGAHMPFTQSNETEGGAPRGQSHYFMDPTTTPATSPLGMIDLMTIVEPFAMEIDQDYDCFHASNPLCNYTLYGPACAPRAEKRGVEIFVDSYGAVDLTWRPAGC